MPIMLRFSDYIQNNASSRTAEKHFWIPTDLLHNILNIVSDVTFEWAVTSKRSVGSAQRTCFVVVVFFFPLKVKIFTGKEVQFSLGLVRTKILRIKPEGKSRKNRTQTSGFSTLESCIAVLSHIFSST